MTIDRKLLTEKVKKWLPQKGVRYKSNLIRAFSLAMIVCAVFLLVLTLFLSDYQHSLPTDAAARLIKAYTEADSAVFAEYWNEVPNAFTDDYRFAAYMNLSFPKEELYYHKGTAKNVGETAYEFKAGNIHIATLTTRETKSTSLFGFNKYEIISFVAHPISHYTIYAPLGTPLVLDGRLLHEQYPPTPGYAHPCFSNVSTNQISEEYSIPDYDAFGTLSVQDVTAADYMIDVDEENKRVFVTPKTEQKIKAEIIDFTLKFVKEYLVFTTQKNAPRGPVLKMTYPQTEFHKIIQQYNNAWRKEYTSDQFKDITIDEIREYSPYEYSCRVSLTHIIMREDGATKTIDFSSTLYLTNRTGTWLTVDMAL